MGIITFQIFILLRFDFISFTTKLRMGGDNNCLPHVYNGGKSFMACLGNFEYSNGVSCCLPVIMVVKLIKWFMPHFYYLSNVKRIQSIPWLLDVQRKFCSISNDVTEERYTVQHRRNSMQPPSDFTVRIIINNFAVRNTKL